MKRICPKGHDKLVTGYNKDHHCAICKRKWESSFNKSPKGKIRNRENQWRKQGIHNPDGSNFKQINYDLKLIEQNGKCKTCGVLAITLSRFLHVDHDHNTGVVRGLLCLQCNAAIAVIERLQGTEIFERYLIEYNSFKNTCQA